MTSVASIRLESDAPRWFLTVPRKDGSAWTLNFVSESEGQLFLDTIRHDAVAEEREACAVIADDMMPSNHNPPPHAAGREYAAIHIASAIRART